MARYLLKNLAYLLFTLVAVSFLTFALSEATPGDVARKLLGAFATQEQVDLLNRQLGLDRPVLVRYLEWANAILHGDMGMSLRFKVPVADLMWSRVANTALLAAISFALIVPLSILLGVLAGTREGSALDRGIFLGATVLASIPDFAMGVFLASIFVVGLGWLPGTAPLTAAGGGWSLGAQLALPVAVIVLFDLGYVVCMIRASMAETMQKPFIRTARLKGLSVNQVVLGHALRHGMLNPVTVILLQITYLVTGVVVVETLFAYPGYGRMMLEAAVAKDVAVVEAGVIVAVIVAVGTQILGDLGYRLLDPRIRL